MACLTLGAASHLSSLRARFAYKYAAHVFGRGSIEYSVTLRIFVTCGRDFVKSYIVWFKVFFLEESANFNSQFGFYPIKLIIYKIFESKYILKLRRNPISSTHFHKKQFFPTVLIYCNSSGQPLVNWSGRKTPSANPVI